MAFDLVPNDPSKDLCSCKCKSDQDSISRGHGDTFFCTNHGRDYKIHGMSRQLRDRLFLVSVLVQLLPLVNAISQLFLAIFCFFENCRQIFWFMTQTSTVIFTQAFFWGRGQVEFITKIVTKKKPTGQQERGNMILNAKAPFQNGDSFPFLALFFTRLPEDLNFLS